MPIDIFDDVPVAPAPAPIPVPVPAPVPAPVSPLEPTAPAASGWSSGLAGMLAGMFLGAFILFVALPWIQSKPDGDDGINPPSVSGLHVLVLEETGKRYTLPEGQNSIFTSPELRDWYDSNCAKENGGGIAYRNYDVDDKPESPTWQKLRDALTLDPPCVLLTDGKRSTAFALPQDPAAMKEKLEKFKK